MDTCKHILRELPPWDTGEDQSCDVCTPTFVEAAHGNVPTACGRTLQTNTAKQNAPSRENLSLGREMERSKSAGGDGTTSCLHSDSSGGRTQKHPIAPVKGYSKQRNAVSLKEALEGHSEFRHYYEIHM